MVAMLMLILLGSPRLRHTTTKIQIQIINSHSLEDMLGKLRVEKVWAQLTIPRGQLSHQIGFPCLPPQCRLNAL